MGRTTLVVVLLTLMCGCSQQRKEQQAKDQLSSWAANGQVLAQQWSRGKVMKPFAKSTVDVAMDSLRGLAKPLESDDKAKDALQKVTNSYDALSRAIEKDDHDGAEQASKDFAAIKQKLDQEKQQ